MKKKVFRHIMNMAIILLICVSLDSNQDSESDLTSVTHLIDSKWIACERSWCGTKCGKLTFYLE